MGNFYFYSIHTLINFLENIYDFNLSVEGLENIPDERCLFVCNHFSRFETAIVPYLFKKVADRFVRVLADKELFEDKGLASFLTSVGCISTDDSYRNEKILYDLIYGRADWLIYPEGNMVKNKNIIRRGKQYFIRRFAKEDEKVHTGAFWLAHQAEFYKKDTQYLLKLCELLSIEKSKCLLPQRSKLQIVPVNLDFSPLLKPAKNPASWFYDNWKNLSEKTKAEIDFEYFLIFKTKKILYFSKPITVEAKKNGYKGEKVLQSLVAETSFNVMSKIYRQSLISLDHIFVLSLYALKGEEFSLFRLQQVYYYLARIIFCEKGKYRLSLDIEHLHRYPQELFLNKNKPFNDAFQRLKLENFIIDEDGAIKIKASFFAERDYKDIFKENAFRIIYNQLNLFSELKKLKIPSKKALEDTLLQEFCQRQEEEYLVDYKEFFLRGSSHPLETGKPYFLKGKKSTAILLCHGYRSSPKEMSFLAEFLNNLSYPIYNMRVKGHGTEAKNLSQIEWEEWFNSMEMAFVSLRQKYNEIIVVGFSTGGLLGLLLASKYPVKKLICINAALAIKDIRFNFSFIVQWWNDLLDLFNNKSFKKEYITDYPENPKLNYTKNYIKGISELSKLISHVKDNLFRVSCPTLIIQSKGDPVVSEKGAYEIDSLISSKEKILCFDFFSSRHTIVFPHKSWDPQPLYEFIFDYIVQN